MDIEELRNQIAAEIKIVESAIEQRTDQITRLEGDNSAARSRTTRLRETLTSLEEALLKVNSLGELSPKGKQKSNNKRKTKRGMIKKVVLDAVIQSAGVGISLSDLLTKVNSNGLTFSREQINACLGSQSVAGTFKKGFDGKWREARFLPDNNV